MLEKKTFASSFPPFRSVMKNRWNVMSMRKFVYENLSFFSFIFFLARATDTALVRSIFSPDFYAQLKTSSVQTQTIFFVCSLFYHLFVHSRVWRKNSKTWNPALSIGKIVLRKKIIVQQQTLLIYFLDFHIPRSEWISRAKVDLSLFPYVLLSLSSSHPILVYRFCTNFFVIILQIHLKVIIIQNVSKLIFNLANITLYHFSFLYFLHRD